MASTQSRRKLIKQLAVGSLALSTANSFAAASLQKKTPVLNNNINHSVCQWTYGHLSLEELCLAVKNIGFKAIDLVGPKGWPTLQKHGIDSSMCNGFEISLTEGWNDKQYHATLIKNYTDGIKLAAKAGYKNIICFSGNRKGMADDVGLKNCAEGLKQIMAQAEKRNVTIQMELLNSKVGQK